MNQQQDDQVTWLACVFKQVMPFEVIEAQYMEPTPPMGMPKGPNMNANKVP